MIEFSPEHSGRVLAFGGTLAMGVLIGAILATMYFRPGLIAIFAQAKAMVFLSLGVGLLTWGIIGLCTGVPHDQPFDWITLLRTPAETIGWGAGLITAGTVALVLSFTGLGRR
ncbi:MAG: hypothetical protein JNL67_12280 [Planctomycetaceae bacterium]|nr:hypothetical protein [Planctomycetaceae bacterium]